MADHENDHTLGELLDGLDHAGQAKSVSFRDLLAEFGDRAITPFILLIAILMVSPLSGIPGTPTLAAPVIVTMAVQALSGRKRLWLPEMLLRKQIPSRRLRQAVIWLRPSCEFLDHHSQRRFGFMTQGVMRWVTLALCVVIALTWPALEILPMVTSIGAATLALLVYGLFTQDGVYVILGYAAVALSLAAGAAVI